MLKSLLIASVVGLCFLGACSSSDDSDPATPPAPTPDADGGTKPTGDAATGPAQACTTVHKSFAVAPKDYYVEFKDTAQAIAVLAPIKHVKYVAAGSDFEKKGTAITAKVFASFRKLYPEVLVGMDTAPLVLIEDTDDFNAAAYGHDLVRTSDKARVTPWVFKFNRGFFQKGVTDVQLELVTAHELGHLFLRNGDKTIFSPVFSREKTAADNIFGEYITSDADLEKEASLVIAAGERVGQLFATELNGFPTPLGTTGFTEATPKLPLYLRYLDYLHANFAATSSNTAACTAGKTKRDQILNLVFAHFNGTEISFDFGADGPMIDQLTKEYAGQESTCLKDVTGTFRAVVIAIRKLDDPAAADEIAKIGTDKTALNAYLKLSQNEIDIDISDPTGNIATKILTLGIRAQDTFRTFVQDPRVDYDTIRVWTHEDEADEVAVRYAKLASYDAGDLIGALFLADKPDEVQACKDTIAKGDIPGYGGTIEPHHSDCWRHHRNLKLQDALKTCPSSWPQ